MLDGTARPYQRCSVSVFDTLDDPGMVFDDEGRSNYYHEYQALAREHLRTGREAEVLLDQLVSRVKANGANRPYDCIMGLSGGVDSSYVAYQAHRLGLRPLAVHFDNGWNSELAVKNIENIVSKLGFDLFTLVVDWDEFRDLQLAYLRASVVDIEVATDHAIAGTLYRLARKHRVKYLLSGSNISTEAVLPPHWIYNKLDHINLLDIHRKFGKRELRTYPLFGTAQKKLSIDIDSVESLSPLNLLDYDYDRAKETLARELGWRDYGAKHHESIFTRFYQCHILPQKFGIDKRKAHLSNRIFAGQLTREAALEKLEEPPCPDDVARSDQAFVLKKLGLNDDEFDLIMRTPPRAHTDFAVERSMAQRFPAMRLIRPLWRAVRGAATIIKRD